MRLIHDKAIRGRTRTGWLDSHHTFSFGGFQDPNRMGFGPLRVINEDRIIPGAGFPAHDHADMDILTLVLSGRLRHEDSLGTLSIIPAGDVQLMSAGRGIEHSEWNASDTEPARFLQIWIMPDTRGGAPAHDQMTLDGDMTGQGLRPVASGTDPRAPLRLGSDSTVSIIRVRDGDTTRFPLAPGRLGFVQMLDGMARIDGERIGAGDGLQVRDDEMPAFEWQSDGAALFFDMAP